MDLEKWRCKEPRVLECELHLTLGVPGVAAPSLGEGFLLWGKTTSQNLVRFHLVAWCVLLGQISETKKAFV